MKRNGRESLRPADRIEDRDSGAIGQAHLELMSIVEGKSDCQMWYRGFPTVGISGTECRRPEYAELPALVAAKYILVLREPMKEGAKGEDAGLAL